MPVATEHCVGGLMTKQTIGEILQPTKGTESYPDIAKRANKWLREQADSGRSLDIYKMSSEQVRRLFEDQTSRPAATYLEALAAVQNINPNILYEAAGYPVIHKTEERKTEPKDVFESVGIALNGAPELSDFSKKFLMDVLKQRVEEDKKSREENR
jgi:hypothetical protein